jgi:hypothetical protein
MAAVAAPPPPPPAAPPPPLLLPDERVRVMLCLVHAQPQPGAAEVAEAAQLARQELERQVAALWRQRVAAAVTIQAAVRGFQARRRLAARRVAAACIQAAYRNMLARRQAAVLLAQQRSSLPGSRGSTRASRGPSRLAAARHSATSRAAQARQPSGRGSPALAKARAAHISPKAVARRRSSQDHLIEKEVSSRAGQPANAGGPLSSGRSGRTVSRAAERPDPAVPTVHPSKHGAAAGNQSLQANNQHATAAAAERPAATKTSLQHRKTIYDTVPCQDQRRSFTGSGAIGSTWRQSSQTSSLQG